MNSPSPITKLFIAAMIWLRVSADAKQPMDMYRQPTITMPKKVLAVVQGSRRVGSRLRYRTTAMQPNKGSQVSI
jgi:hypothetical protein